MPPGGGDHSFWGGSSHGRDTRATGWVCAVGGLFFFAGGDLGVVEGGDEGDAAEDVAEEGGGEPAEEEFFEGDVAVEEDVGGVDGAGDDVGEAGEADDVGDDDDDRDAGGFGGGEEPDHQRDQPAGEDRAAEGVEEGVGEGGVADVEEGLLGGGFEDVGLGGDEREADGAD